MFEAKSTSKNRSWAVSNEPNLHIPLTYQCANKQQPLPSLQIWIKSQTGPTLRTCLSTLTNLILSLCLSERTVWNPTPIYFPNNPLEEVLSFKLLGLTVCHDLLWESHIYNLASKARRRLSILRRAKFFLGPPELLTTYKAFVRSLMEYCSPLWAGAPASHLISASRCGNKGISDHWHLPR